MHISSTNDYLFGTYESDAIETVLKEIREDTTVFDIGANFGYYAMIFAQVTRNTIYAFEPLPSNLKLLGNHVDRNKVGNIRIMPIAISDKDGKVEFSNEVNYNTPLI